MSNEKKPARYNVGIEPGNDEALALAKSKAISVIDHLDFGDVRTVIVGRYEQSDAVYLRDYSGIMYVEIDDAAEPL